MYYLKIVIITRLKAHSIWERGLYTKSSILDAGRNLLLLCVRQSDAASFCENYAKLCCDAKHLEKGLNWGWLNFWCLFFFFFFFFFPKKSALFGQYWTLHKFSRLDLEMFDWSLNTPLITRKSAFKMFLEATSSPSWGFSKVLKSAAETNLGLEFCCIRVGDEWVN